MYRNICVFFIVLMLSFWGNNACADSPLFVFKSGKLFGFMDATGQVVVPAKYVGVKDFAEDLAAVNINDASSMGQWGFINRQGKEVIAPQFWLANSFQEGLAGVMTQGGIDWVYIDQTGQIVIDRLTDEKPYIYAAQPFKNGIACVEAAKDRTAFKRTKGFSNERSGQKGMWGFVDRTGEVIALEFDWATSFVDSLAVVLKDGKFGYVKPDGSWAIEPKFDRANSFSEGLACVQIKEKYGYVNQLGDMVIPLQYDLAGNFSEGLARVRVDGEYGFIDDAGAWMIAPQFDRVMAFSGGFAVVVRNGKYGYVDKTGTFIKEPMLQYGQAFSEGVAAVKVDGLWGYMDGTGQVVIAPQFDLAQSFENGLARVGWGRSWGDAKWGYINRDGQMIFRE